MNYVNRLKSLGWRLAVMLLVFVIDFVLKNEGAIIPVQYVIFAGLIGGEISKFLNTYLASLPDQETLK